MPWPQLAVDVDADGMIDLADYADLTNQWLTTNCQESNNWCAGADINHSTAVDTVDISLMAEYWLDPAVVPPQP